MSALLGLKDLVAFFFRFFFAISHSPRPPPSLRPPHQVCRGEAEAEEDGGGEGGRGEEHQDGGEADADATPAKEAAFRGKIGGGPLSATIFMAFLSVLTNVDITG